LISSPLAKLFPPPRLLARAPYSSPPPFLPSPSDDVNPFFEDTAPEREFLDQVFFGCSFHSSRFWPRFTTSMVFFCPPKLPCFTPDSNLFLRFRRLSNTLCSVLNKNRIRIPSLGALLWKPMPLPPWSPQRHDSRGYDRYLKDLFRVSGISLPTLLDGLRFFFFLKFHARALTLGVNTFLQSLPYYPPFSPIHAVLVHFSFCIDMRSSLHVRASLIPFP